MDLSRTFQQIKAYANNRNLPLIPFCAKNVSILKEPSSFYEFLIRKNQEARRRIALSALYIGTGEKERELVQALCDNLNQNPILKANIALDFNRARRLDSHGKSSITILQNALSYHSVSLNLIKTSSSGGTFQRILSQFNRWNELSSTYHSKFAVFDDDVLFTGANLSNIYFDKRRDRYMIFRDCGLLGDYLNSFLEDINSTSQSLKKIVENHNYNFTSILEKHTEIKETDSYILPLCQHGPSGVVYCDEFLKFLETILPPGAQIHLSSGYFNPRLILKLNSVVAPSEQANGFYNGAGLLSFVPRIYTALLQKFMISNPQCSINLYTKPGWSFHAKGLWIEGIDDISINMVGSSNFNWRSSTRDFELQFVVITTDKELSRALRLEYQDLLSESSHVPSNILERVNPIYNIVANIVKSLL